MKVKFPTWATLAVEHAGLELSVVPLELRYREENLEGVSVLLWPKKYFFAIIRDPSQHGADEVICFSTKEEFDKWFGFVSLRHKIEILYRSDSIDKI